ncbi:NmrA family NAD(P)-binding protein [Grimontia kaedaensis]|uniref:NmrA family NAD(P)-binding protein n=1 Tax=Grimontia kaedaensis TaxID=2872157 RepID=A0ABY4WWE7_9GAMM|nr:NmrA family NAD(P)-binding protein [Grimontia kaedaensis]USH03454.1 NmrA family NAD(P)-binding protein [Grimontia kaedaensis]
MIETKLYVVMGVTGRTGSVAAKTLLNDNKRVRVVMRDASRAKEWIELGAEVALADINDVPALSEVFSGADGAYIVSPPQYSSKALFSQAESMAQSITKAALVSKLPKLVALSSVGAHQADNAGWIGMNRKLEEILGSSGLNVTFLRAAYFMENWAPLVKIASGQGRLPSFLSPLDRKLPMIATGDIGRIAAESLNTDWDGIRILDLEGPNRYSPRDVANSLALKLGKPITAISIPESDWKNAIGGMGFSEQAISGFVEMTRGLNSGHIDFSDELNSVSLKGVITVEKVLESLI